MIEISQLILLVLVETIIGLLILSGLLLFFALRRKGRIREAAHHLAQRVQSDKPARTERLNALLQEKYGYEGQELEQAVHDITQAEMRLFQNLINGYIKDDQVHLQQMDVDEENLVLAYQSLKMPSAELSPAPETAGEDGEELVRLQEENQRLSDELRVTMDTMGRMLNEYSSMFAGGSDKPLSRAEAAQAEMPEEASADEESGDREAEVVADSDDNIEEVSADTESSAQQSDAPMDLPDELYDGSQDQASALDEEVSEIIDEVMEIADEMDQAGSAGRASEPPQEAVAESLMDDLEQVDIEIPEMMPAEDLVEAAEIDIPEPDIAAEPVSESIPEIESEPEAEPENVADTELDALLDAVPASGLETESDLDALLDAVPETENPPGSGLEDESELDALLDAVPESEIAPESEPETESELDSLLDGVPEAEPGSLEEEWAKLLEEDAESKQDPKVD